MKKFSVLFVLIFILQMLTGCNVSNIIDVTPVDQTQEIPAVTHTGSDLQVYYIDVGQADCSLTILPNNKTMLIDAGNNEDGQMLVNTFKSMGITKIDYLIGTHPHEDHIGGLDNIIKNFDIGEIYMPEKSSDSMTFEDVVNAIYSKQLKITKPVPGTNIYQDENTTIKILAPISDAGNDLNNHSIVIRMDYINNSFLFTGDAETKVENEILSKGYNVDVDVLKVGHHGSDTSSSTNFLKKVTPKYAIIQVGENNEYGHPHNETINKLKNFGATIYRNDLNGTIKVTSNGKTITVVSDNSGSGTSLPSNTTQNNTKDDIKEPTPPVVATENESNMVYVTPNGKKYHKKDCVHLGKNIRGLTVENAKNEGYEPCKNCH